MIGRVAEEALGESESRVCPQTQSLGPAPQGRLCGSQGFPALKRPAPQCPRLVAREGTALRCGSVLIEEAEGVWVKGVQIAASGHGPAQVSRKGLTACHTPTLPQHSRDLLGNQMDSATESGTLSGTFAAVGADTTYTGGGEATLPHSEGGIVLWKETLKETLGSLTQPFCSSGLCLQPQSSMVQPSCMAALGHRNC